MTSTDEPHLLPVAAAGLDHARGSLATMLATVIKENKADGPGCLGLALPLSATKEKGERVI